MEPCGLEATLNMGSALTGFIAEVSGDANVCILEDVGGARRWEGALGLFEDDDDLFFLLSESESESEDDEP